MGKLKITLVSGERLEHFASEIEVMESKTGSIARGKCFVRIKENDHHYEISKREFTRLSEVIDMISFAGGQP
jgi:hypothetical protein